MQVSDAIARAVAAECPDTPIFGLIGDGNLPICGAIDRDGVLRHIMTRHEGAAVAMAEGWGRATNRLALASVTTGPGLTHAGTSIFTAACSRIPMVILTGAVPQERPTGLQELMIMDQRKFAESFGALHARLQTAASLDKDILEAFYLARTRRLPVVLDIPLDLQRQDVSDGWSYTPSTEYLPQDARLALDKASTTHIAQLLVKSQRTLIVAGRGGFEAAPLLEQIADRVGALVSTTLPAKGLFDTHEWSLGVVGGYSTEAGKELIRAADLVLAFGAELGHFTTQAGSLFEGRTVIRIESRPFENGLPLGAVETFQADSSAAAEGLLAALPVTPSTSMFRTDAVKAMLSTVERFEGAPDGKVHPASMMQIAGELIPAHATVVIGGGHFTSFPATYLDRPAEGGFIMPFGAACIGQAVPVAIGAGQAEPDRPIVVFEGDGSLQMHIQELETAHRLGSKLMVVVMNDEALSAERINLERCGFDPTIVMYDSPDFVSIARGFGWEAVCVTEISELKGAFELFAASSGPVLVDVRISREVMINPTGHHDLSHALPVR